MNDEYDPSFKNDMADKMEQIYGHSVKITMELIKFYTLKSFDNSNQNIDVIK